MATRFRTDLALKRAAEEQNRTTGRVFSFVVETMKDDRSDLGKSVVAICALTTADAWRLIGATIERFMDGPDGLTVNNVTLVRETNYDFGAKK